MCLKKFNLSEIFRASSFIQGRRTSLNCNCTCFCLNLDSISSLVTIATSDAEFIKSQTMEDKSEDHVIDDEQVKIEIIAAKTKQCEVKETVSTSILK